MDDQAKADLQASWERAARRRGFRPVLKRHDGTGYWRSKSGEILIWSADANVTRIEPERPNERGFQS